MDNGRRTLTNGRRCNEGALGEHVAGLASRDAGD
jgi:hypothetical protein